MLKKVALAILTTVTLISTPAIHTSASINYYAMPATVSNITANMVELTDVNGETWIIDNAIGYQIDDT